MLKSFKKINRMLFEFIVWVPFHEENGKWYNSKYDSKECWLEINDFPDEPLWTLYYKGDKLDIEDTPFFWKIKD